MKVQINNISNFKSVKNELSTKHMLELAESELYFKIENDYFMTFEPLNINPYDDTIFLLYIPKGNLPSNVKRQFIFNELLPE
jgi:hypothetical protein